MRSYFLLLLLFLSSITIASSYEDKTEHALRCTKELAQVKEYFIDLGYPFKDEYKSGDARVIEFVRDGITIYIGWESGYVLRSDVHVYKIFIKKPDAKRNLIILYDWWKNVYDFYYATEYGSELSEDPEKSGVYASSVHLFLEPLGFKEYERRVELIFSDFKKSLNK